MCDSYIRATYTLSCFVGFQAPAACGPAEIDFFKRANLSVWEGGLECVLRVMGLSWVWCSAAHWSAFECIACPREIVAKCLLSLAWSAQ